MLKKTILAITLLTGVASANASDGFYVGFGYNFDSGETKDQSYEIEDKSASSFSFNYGYNVNKYLGLELRGLIGLNGTESGNVSSNCDPYNNMIDDGNGNDIEADCDPVVADLIKLDSQMGINLKLSLPLNQYVSVIGKYGYAYSTFSIEKKSFQNIKNIDGEKIDVRTTTDKKTNINGYGNTYGVGLTFDMKDGGQFDVIYNRLYDYDELEYSGLELSYMFQF